MITLSNATWQALAAEYDETLTGVHPDRVALYNAGELAKYVRARTGFAPDDALEPARVWVLGADHSWLAVEDPEPYADLDAMVSGLSVSGRRLVSDCFHDHPVFTREDNLRFRAWHDTGHLEHQLTFSADDEVILFIQQARDVWTFNRDGSDREIVDALFCESVYQLAWAHVHGEFPDRQVVRTPGPVGRALLDAWGL